MEKKQTAVEWLVKEYRKVYGVDSSYVMELNIEQAKQMEKQQIMDAHGVKTFQGCKQGVDFWTQKGGEQYYNETFGGTK
jgi:hypothetical protein